MSQGATAIEEKSPIGSETECAGLQFYFLFARVRIAILCYVVWCICALFTCVEQATVFYMLL